MRSEGVNGAGEYIVAALYTCILHAACTPANFKELAAC